MSGRVILITGGNWQLIGELLRWLTIWLLANQGIGFEMAKQLTEQGHTVYLGARDVTRGNEAV